MPQVAINRKSPAIAMVSRTSLVTFLCTCCRNAALGSRVVNLENNIGRNTLRRGLPTSHLYCPGGSVARRAECHKRTRFAAQFCPTESPHWCRGTNASKEGLEFRTMEIKATEQKQRLRPAIHQSRQPLRQNRDFGSRGCDSPPMRSARCGRDLPRTLRSRLAGHAPAAA